MRDKNEILSLVLRYATENESVRAAMMNGSRVNPYIGEDLLQDYDVVYFVRDVAEFRRRDSIPAYFGEIMILQLPEEMQDPPPEGGDNYVYLMQFTDGTRIDLGFAPASRAKEFLSDSLTVVLMDKDGILGQVPPPSDLDYLTHAPTEKAFADCCNEFWWLNPYVAKAIWRDQLPHAKSILEDLLRTQLVKMLGWSVVVTRRKPTPLGKHGGNLSRYLAPNEWALFRGTYVDSDYGRMWTSLLDAGVLFRSAASRVAAELGYHYPSREDQLVSEFVLRIRQLPADAREL